MRNAVSLFAGAGGFCEGVQLAGFKVLCAVEMDPAACRTHAANFNNVALFEGDISRFLRDKIKGVPSRAALVEAGIDLVYGGPPCQGFSQIGPRKPNDPRNRLYKEFVRVVRELKPAMFVMENVPNMITMKDGHFKKQILKAFHRAGYKRTAIIPLISSDFGVPQHRRRVFIFGLRNGLKCRGGIEEEIKKFLSKESGHDLVTVAEAISDLPARISKEDIAIAYPVRHQRL
jgi:DNA (cytosine-5)-methyltransferase 1